MRVFVCLHLKKLKFGTNNHFSGKVTLKAMAIPSSTLKAMAIPSSAHRTQSTEKERGRWQSGRQQNTPAASLPSLAPLTCCVPNVLSPRKCPPKNKNKALPAVL